MPNLSSGICPYDASCGSVYSQPIRPAKFVSDHHNAVLSIHICSLNTWIVAPVCPVHESVT